MNRWDTVESGWRSEDGHLGSGKPEDPRGQHEAERRGGVRKGGDNAYSLQSLKQFEKELRKERGSIEENEEER